MPKYKVGDVAALFPKPSAPKTTSGQKIQSLFNDFYSKSKKSNPFKLEHKKKEVNYFQKESPADIKSEPKKKKRKFLDVVGDTTSIPKDVEMFPAKPKKMKAAQKLSNIQDSPQKMVMDEENYFPRNKKKSSSKKFNSSKENSTLFPFNATDDENSFNFNMEDQRADVPKKKKKTKFQTETIVSDSLEAAPTKKPKKMKKMKETKPQVAEIDESEAAYTMNEILNVKHSPKKEKKKKKKERKNKPSDKNLISLEQNSSSNIQDHEDQNETEEPRSKIQFQFQKAKKLISPLENVFERKIKLESKLVVGKKSNKPLETEERISRTLFVGNLPMNMTRPLLSKLFAPFGSIETCRLRGLVPVKATIPKKIAAIQNNFHAGQKSCIGYIVFKKEEDAIQATALNGTPVGDHHIVVNRASACGGRMQYDDKRSVFIGNLPFDVEDEAIWAAFAECGEIEAVRVIRDRETGAGKGFGYILFKKIQSKENALAMSDVKISDREIRIKGVNSNPRKSKPVAGSARFNAMKRKAHKLQGKPGNKRKSLKKLMNREKIHHEKKKIANIFKKFSAK